MRTKVFLLFACLALVAHSSWAQVVKSFTEAPDIISGNDQRRDLNRELCAIVKVRVVDEIDRVDGNVMGDIVSYGTEKWVYMAKDSRRMTVFLKHFLPVEVNFIDYQIRGLKKNTVYVLVIETPNTLAGTDTEPVVDDTPANNYVVFQVSPKNAILYVDDNLYQPNADGQLSLLLPKGVHKYKADAVGGYESSQGTFTIGKEKVTVPIRLRSQKTHLAITAETPGSKIFINDTFVSEQTWSCDTLPGVYKVVVKCEGYEDYENTVTLEKNKQSVIRVPAQAPVYGSITIDYSPAGSYIYIDGNLMGQSPMNIKNLLVGKHELVVSKDGYNAKTSTFTLLRDKDVMVMGELEKEQAQQQVTQLQVAEPVQTAQQRNTTAAATSSQSLEPVDIGLSVKWASSNLILADSEGSLGMLFAWGEAESKKKFTIKNYQHGNGKEIYPFPLGASIAATHYDAAFRGTKSQWRMPTKDEMDELLTKCKIEWAENGISFIGPNGNSVFFPTGGLKANNMREGYYWTASNDKDTENVAYFLHFNLDAKTVRQEYLPLYQGMLIRPVLNK